MNYNLITILGPTAVGKTRLGALAANDFKGEVISADSRQVYKGMDIGTGKDLDDYVVNGGTVPYHLIDILEPDEEYNLFLFKKHFTETYQKITNKGRIPFLVGGTGMYLNSILKNYCLDEVDFNSGRYEELDKLSIEELRQRLKYLSPSLHNTTDLLFKDRIIKAIIVAEGSEDKEEKPNLNLNTLVLGVFVERSELKKRITERLKKRLQNGMVEEVEQLVNKGIGYDKLDFFGLEYRYIGAYLKGELNYNDMYQKLNSAIHKFAKRQMTWFRKMEREGIQIHWLNGADYHTAKRIIEENYFADS